MVIFYIPLLLITQLPTHNPSNGEEEYEPVEAFPSLNELRQRINVPSFRLNIKCYFRIRATSLFPLLLKCAGETFLQLRPMHLSLSINPKRLDAHLP